MVFAMTAGRAAVVYEDGGEHVLADGSQQTEAITVRHGTTLRFVEGAVLAVGGSISVLDTARLVVSGGTVDGGVSSLTGYNQATIEISGGRFGPFDIGSIIMRNQSRLILSGGVFGGVQNRSGEIVGLDDATVIITGGFFGGAGRLSGFVEMRDRNLLDISGGMFGASGQDSGKVSIRSGAAVIVSGGVFDGAGPGPGAGRLTVSGIGRVDRASFVNGARMESLFPGRVVVAGRSFNLPFGEVVPLVGDLTGTFADGSACRLPFYRGIDPAALNGVIELVASSVNEPPMADAGGPYVVEEGGVVALNGSATDPDDDPAALEFAWDLDGDGLFETPGASVDLDALNLGGPSSYPLALRVTDAQGAEVVATSMLEVVNVDPVIDALIPLDGTSQPLPLGGVASFECLFNDPGAADTHLIEWEWGDGSAEAVGIEPGVRSSAAAHAYAQPGVYRVVATVIDDDGGAGVAFYEYVVVYDPNGGFITGGGFIHSPAGACLSEPTLTGKAHFGFVSKYRKGASTPVGETEFNFATAGLQFHSDAYHWLVVAGAKALYKGDGAVNGQPGYGFLVSAIDGGVNGDGSDRFRIKIWHGATGEVLYDNALGAADDSDPMTVIGGGSIVVHAPVAGGNGKP
jgi:hypothetical protein